MAQGGKGNQFTNSGQNFRNHTVGCVKIIKRDVFSNLVKVPKDFRVNRNPSWGAAGGAFLTEMGLHLVAGDKLHPSAFQVVITAVQGDAHLGDFIKVSGHRVLNEFVRSAPALRGKSGELLFRLRSELHFHSHQPTPKPASAQVLKISVELRACSTLAPEVTHKQLPRPSLAFFAQHTDLALLFGSEM